MTEAPPPPPQEPDGSAGGATPPPPPAPEYGQPPAYGQQPPAYGQQPPAYGAPAYGAPDAMPAGVQLASWGLRAKGALVDFVGPEIVAYILYFINRPLGTLAFLAVLAWALYNAYLGGQTGQSVGKKWAGIRLARESDGQNIGGGLGIGRYFVHILDSIPCVPIGFLWPLWDAKRQTFADKILKTVVVKV